MPRQLCRVQRVYKEIDGSVLIGSMTTSWTDGSSLAVEHVTDFNGKGGEAVLEPGTPRAELILYSQTDEVTDELLGVTRPNARFSHAAGTFVQQGATPTSEKFVDGYLDDENVVAPGIPVPAELAPWFAINPDDPAAERTAWVDQDEDGTLKVASIPPGSNPKFDEDLEVLPEVATEPTPPVDEIPASGVLPVAPNLSVSVRTLVNVEPTWFIDWSVTHSGLKTDGSAVSGLRFRIEFLEGSTVKYRTGDTSGFSGSQMVEGGKSYTVRAYALDLANQLSAPDTETISTGADSTIPATPTGVTLTGGANGGGAGIIYGQVNAATESDFSHFEIHASTSSGFTANDSTIVHTTKGTVFPVVRTASGPFGYSTPVHVRLKSVDTSNNKSPASAQVSGTAQQIASADVTDLQSDNYSPGSLGWRITKSGNAELNNGTFRGIVSAATFIALSSSTPGIVIDGSIPRITVGTGLRLDGAGLGSIQFGSNCTIYGSGSGSISIGTSITIDGALQRILAGSNVVIDGLNSRITVGSITLDGPTSKVTGGTFEGVNIVASAFKVQPDITSGAWVQVSEDNVEFYDPFAELEGRISLFGNSLKIEAGDQVRVHTPFFTETAPQWDTGLSGTTNLGTLPGSPTGWVRVMRGDGTTGRLPMYT